MGEIATLIHDEPVRLDSDMLGTLHRQLGPTGAENVISRALEELSLRLIEIRRLHRRDELESLAKVARSLIAIADQVGMTRFAKVAADVSRCATLREHPSLCATLARLERLADSSLMAMWDLQDMRV